MLIEINTIYNSKFLLVMTKSSLVTNNFCLILADMLTEENEKFVEFGIGGLCNCSLGKKLMKEKFNSHA